MASSINASNPTSGNATTASVRANFSAAKSEIEALQAKTQSVTTITAYAATLLDDATAADARTTLELGTAATTAASDYATAAQGALADTALQPADVGTIAAQDANSVDIDGGTIDGATIGGSTPAAGTFTTLTATGQVSLGGAAGAEGLRVTQAASTVNYLQVSGGTTGNAPEIIAAGADTNISMIYAAKGAGLHSFRAGSSENFRVFAGTNRVNHVEVAGGTTGNGVTVSAQGANTNVDLRLFPKGTGLITFGTASAAAATPANFSADRYLAIKDSSGTTYYLPLMATTW